MRGLNLHAASSFLKSYAKVLKLSSEGFGGARMGIKEKATRLNWKSMLCKSKVIQGYGLEKVAKTQQNLVRKSSLEALLHGEGSKFRP